MSPEESRHLKIGQRVLRKESDTDLGTVASVSPRLQRRHRGALGVLFTSTRLKPLASWLHSSRILSGFREPPVLKLFNRVRLTQAIRTAQRVCISTVSGCRSLETY